MNDGGIPILGSRRPGVQPAPPYRPELDNLGFEALQDVIVAVMDDPDELTKGGIIIPATRQKTPFHVALSVGPDVKGIEVGDRIMATGGANMESKSGNRVYFFRAKDVLALVHRLDGEPEDVEEPADTEPPEQGEEPVQ